MTYRPTYATDEEWEKAVQAAFGYFPTPEEDARDGAGADQRVAAMRESERYNCMFLPSGERHLGLNSVGKVRSLKLYSSDCRPFGILHDRDGDEGEYKDWYSGDPDLRLPPFDEDNPAHSRGLAVVFDREDVIHVRFESVEKLIADNMGSKWKCSFIYRRPVCDVRATEFLMLSGGQYLYASPICKPCKQYLLAEADQAVKQAHQNAIAMNGGLGR